MKTLLSSVVTLVLLMIALPDCAQAPAWGWGGHEYINEKAVDYLPQEMSFWVPQTQFLHDHAVDPDVDSHPQSYHYINIDLYDEFFEGTFPHDMDDLIGLYGQGTVEDNGTVPWVIDIWCEELTELMESGNWDEAWQIAAELGHYVADAHEPLHITLNYDGQLTGNDGIHSRYETQMINAFEDDIALIPGTGEYWPNVLDSTFKWIDTIYPYVDEILAADNVAAAEDPGYGSTYYASLWEETEDLTNLCMNLAVYNLACIWITCWENAGSPIPTDITGTEDGLSLTAFPNPGEDVVWLKYDGDPTGKRVLIYDATGKLAEDLMITETGPISLNLRGYEAGIYTLVLTDGKATDSVKIQVNR